MLEINESSLLDTLYGGDNGRLHEPEIIKLPDSEDLLLSDFKQSHPQPETNKSDYEIIDTSEIASAVLNGVDIRPRIYDNATKQWVLLDTGAQVSCCPPPP